MPQIAQTSASAANYQAIVAAIDEKCESFVTLPGMNSFYTGGALQIS
jgi:hypothetical protein